ncbi:sulfotransferase [Dokdonella sp.]|uniref:sulfotransferase n=1 Tax=Dokdonella sp. TaxID=2291710 RepID=UPI003528E28C
MPTHKHHVPFSQARLAALFARFPGLGPRLARWESSTVRGELEAVQPGPPVWICGMARSGSTVLLEMLNGLPGFTSHRYSDYPWLWTPYWWNHLSARLPLPKVPPQERAHRDRIEVNRDSPEAFEEVFWMHHFPDRHNPAVDQALDADVDATAFARFLDEHQRKLLAVRNAARYLAKANYHLPRLGLLHRQYPKARFVIPVRNPLDQVASLCKQDALFCQLDREDPQVSAHLARIGHFEFGPHKRALNLGDAKETEAIADCFKRGDMAEGYARQWVVQYGHALQRMRSDPALAKACLWVSHDRLCDDPAGEIDRLAMHLELDASDRQSLTREWQHRLDKPAYYKPSFSDADGVLIERIAGGLWGALQTLVV